MTQQGSATIPQFSQQALEHEVINMFQSATNIVQSYENGDWKDPNNSQLEGAYQAAKHLLSYGQQHKSDLGSISIPTTVNFTSSNSGTDGSGGPKY